MDLGESKEIESYLITRCLSSDPLFTVWSENREFPYQIRKGNKGNLLCSCPDFVFRGKERNCKHLELLRKEKLL